jgi:kynurenine formamidase
MLYPVLVDLSHPVHAGMPIYPGDPAVEITPALTHARDTVQVLRLRLGSHSGTHVDAPFHVRADLPRLDALPLDRFVGPAVLVDARGLAPRTGIGPAHLDPVRPLLGPGVVVLVVTGWSQYWGTAGYDAHPWPTPDLAREVVAAGVRTLGLDAPSVDATPAPDAEPESLALPTHLVLATAGCVIAENLTGLEALLDARSAGAAIEVSLLPLPLADADGAPVRAVARLSYPTASRS